MLTRFVNSKLTENTAVVIVLSGPFCSRPQKKFQINKEICDCFLNIKQNLAAALSMLTPTNICTHNTPVRHVSWY